MKKIFAVGGKISVKEAYERLKNNKDVANFFLVDGDFDRYKMSETLVVDDRFIYLEMYNIESYLVDEVACCSFVKTKINKLDEEVRFIVNFKYWYDTIVEQAKELFFWYCYVQIHHPTMINVSRNPYLFIDRKTGFKRCDSDYKEYSDEIERIDVDWEDKLQIIIDRYETINGKNYNNLICGKFLLESLKVYIGNFVTSRICNDDFKWWMINNFDVNKLNYVRDIVNKYCSNNTSENSKTLNSD